jgi:hypothetical protein
MRSFETAAERSCGVACLDGNELRDNGDDALLAVYLPR